MATDSDDRLQELIESLKGSSESDTAWCLSLFRSMAAARPEELDALQRQWQSVLDSGHYSAVPQSTRKHMELLGFANIFKRWIVTAFGRDCIAQGKSVNESLLLAKRFDSVKWLDLAARLLDSPEWKEAQHASRSDRTAIAAARQPGTVIRSFNTLLILTAWGLVIARLCGWVQWPWWSVAGFFVAAHWIVPALVRRLL